MEKRENMNELGSQPQTKTKELTKWAIVSTIYIVLSLAFPPLSFGQIQFRLGEILMVLPFYNKKSIMPLTIGCFLVNMFSTVSAIDMLVGTTATFLASILVSKIKKDWWAPLIMGIINGIFVGIMLHIVFDLPPLLTIIYITISEIIAVSIGVYIMRKLQHRGWFQTYILPTN